LIWFGKRRQEWKVVRLRETGRQEAEKMGEEVVRLVVDGQEVDYR
jgi:hypothetical protein